MSTSILLSSLRREQSMGRVRSFSNDVSEEDKRKLMNLSVPLPHRENERLMLLRECQILDSPAEESYDRFTFMSARIFKVPIAVISLVDVDRQWFKARVGLSVSETHRDSAFCSYCILEKTERILLVNDALQDSRFAMNPLVVGHPFIRFYAGASLLIDGIKVGTLCIIDTVPCHAFSTHQQQILIDLADTVSEMMATRRRAYLDQQFQGIKIQQSVLTMIQSPLADLQESFTTLNRMKNMLISFSSLQSKESLAKEIFLLDEIIHNFNSEMLYFEQLLDLSLRSLSSMVSQKHKHEHHSCAKPQQIQLYSSSFSASTMTDNIFRVVHLTKDTSEQQPQSSQHHSVQLSRSMDTKHPLSSSKDNNLEEENVIVSNNEPTSMAESNHRELASNKENPVSATNIINITDTIILILATLITHVVEVHGNVITISLPNELPSITEINPLLFIQLQCQFPSLVNHDEASISEQEMKERNALVPMNNENSCIKSECSQATAETPDTMSLSTWIEGVIYSPLMDTVYLLLSSVFGTVAFHPKEHFFGLEIPLLSWSASLNNQSLEDFYNKVNDTDINNCNDVRQNQKNISIKDSWQQFVELEKIEFSIEELAKLLSAHPHFQGSFCSTSSSFSFYSSAVAISEPHAVQQNTLSLNDSKARDDFNSLANAINNNLEPLVDVIVKSSSPALSLAVMTTIAPLLSPQLTRLSQQLSQSQLSRSNSHQSNINTSILCVNNINSNTAKLDAVHNGQQRSPVVSHLRTTSMHNVVILSDECTINNHNNNHFANNSNNNSNNNSMHCYLRHRTFSNDRDRSDVTQVSNRSDSFGNQRLPRKNSKIIHMKVKTKPSPHHHNRSYHNGNHATNKAIDNYVNNDASATTSETKVTSENATDSDSTFLNLQNHDKKKNTLFGNFWQRLFPIFSSTTPQVVYHSGLDSVFLRDTEAKWQKQSNDSIIRRLVSITQHDSTSSPRVVPTTHSIQM